MENKKTDIRILKTKKQIRNVFLDLLEEQHFDTISVSQITEQAMISRSTFYDHYEDKFALLDSIYEDVNNQFTEILNTYFSDETKKFNMDLANKILSYVLKNARLFRILLSSNVPPRDMFQSLKEMLEPRCMEFLQRYPNKYSLDNEYVVQVYSSIIFISLQWIAKHQNPMDVVKIVALADKVRDLFYE